MKIIKDKSLNYVPHILTSGISSGVKRKNKKDLCVIYSEVEAVAAGVFTTNKAKAAPVVLSLENIKNYNTQAIVINSGVANACTGELGLKNGKDTIECISKCLNIKKEEIIIESTGIIGKQLPMELIIEGIKKGCKSLSKENSLDPAEAIKTTDTFVKAITVEEEIDGKTIIISGIAKGSGMIHPNMATMLSNVVTNVNITKEMLQKALKDSVEDTYNMISVDGDTSTNDMVVVLSNKTANNKIIDCENEDYKIFKKVLDYVNVNLAKMIAKDGEGATKLVEVNVKNAKTIESAKKSAKSVVCSNLTKCALFGNDANWGRIICALGYSKAELDVEKVDVYIKSLKGKIKIVEDSVELNFDEDKVKDILNSKEVILIIDLKSGDKNASAWGCDLSYDYVKINGSYRS